MNVKGPVAPPTFTPHPDKGETHLHEYNLFKKDWSDTFLPTHVVYRDRDTYRSTTGTRSSRRTSGTSFTL